VNLAEVSLSEQSNIERVVRMYQAFGRGEIADIIDQLVEDVRWVVRIEPVVPWGGDFSGRGNAPRFFDAIARAVDVQSFTPQDFVAQGDRVASFGEFGFRVKANGKSGTTRWAFLWTFHGDKVAAYEQFHDPGLAAAFR
jgi:ketosteroid isomerase-like protein